ncbi:hypothetical protein A2524_02805 [Candidatus Wolfebacteria bacterium RIFOXYD12_FULL_48_21]|nr:MAG: hypothetical protein A2524_02805 [Candidatus Wolfebacteria bacterium RIFOXYD12_FULL_48_21]
MLNNNMTKEIDYKKIHIKLIGVVHHIQAKGHIKRHIKKMRVAGFSEELLGIFDASLKTLRDKLLQLCEEENPDLIVEEGGPYDKIPGDGWKKNIYSGKTILEEKYGDKHIFVDAKMQRFLTIRIKPSTEKREKAFVQGLEEYLRKKDSVRNIAFIVGVNHLERVKGMLENKGFQVEAHDLEKEYRTEDLKKKVKDEARIIGEKKRKEKKDKKWQFWRR